MTQYFLVVKNIPMRQILVPVGYGATHPVASNQNAQGRGLNRHVDVKILVNKIFILRLSFVSLTNKDDHLLLPRGWMWD